jgi:hypothetical protein
MFFACVCENKTDQNRENHRIGEVHRFANSFVYYGLTFNSSNLGGSIMVNFLLNGLTEIPACALSLFILLKKGRKLPYATFMILAGVFLLCTILIPRDMFRYNWPIVLMAVMGKMCITGEIKNINKIFMSRGNYQLQFRKFHILTI